MKGDRKSGVYPAEDIMVDASALEQENFAVWTRAHEKACSPESSGTSRWAIRIVSTPVGDGVDVICQHCNEAEEITDYASW